MERATSNKAVILTSLPVEYKAVRAHLMNLREEVHERGTIYERGDFVERQCRWDILMTETAVGNVAAAIETERAIAHFHPSIVLFVGIAGGIKDVQLGDVVAATKVYGYESGKAQGTSFLVRPELGRSSYPLVERAKAEARKSDWLQRVVGDNQKNIADPDVLVGPIAAGEKVIASQHSPLVQFLESHYNDAIAVEMEGYGFLQATYSNHTVKSLVIRGIANLLDDKHNAEVTGWQTIAADHASAFAFQILAKLTPQEIPPREVSKSIYTIPF